MDEYKNIFVVSGLQDFLSSAQKPGQLKEFLESSVVKDMLKKSP